MFLMTELSTFYLKFVLWVPPEHWMNGVRLFFLLLIGAVGLRETFQLMDDPECEKLGRQSWVLLAIVVTELLICVKFGWETITKPLPRSIGKYSDHLLLFLFFKLTSDQFIFSSLVVSLWSWPSTLHCCQICDFQTYKISKT